MPQLLGSMQDMMFFLSLWMKILKTRLIELDVSSFATTDHRISSSTMTWLGRNYVNGSRPLGSRLPSKNGWNWLMQLLKGPHLGWVGIQDPKGMMIMMVIYIYIYIYHLPWLEFQVQNLRFWGKHVTVSTFCGNSHERPANIHWCRSLSIKGMSSNRTIGYPQRLRNITRSRVEQRKPWQFRSTLESVSVPSFFQ